ncbi:DUF262 domain-containing protein [Cellulomonas xiejunii]|uniref:DUF262 domain-containing protein n=1 Tax=Cellulomonas xiejunii TaxID=2968083 RepID=UPI001D0E8516|nr:DUF262 domain-containing protein [Cellulomonas xiejunii]MCC2315606.1 DUF262 domain-containing protein [Cellulomonas xiejunii]
MTAPGDAPISADQVEEWYEEEDELESPDVQPDTKVVDLGEKYASSQLRVVRETKDYQLDYLQHALRPGRELIDISPAYQRRLRWSNKKKSLLIESLLLNIPVPPIFLYERDYNEYEVIDGRQRLDAISSFLSNDYSLTGLEYWPELRRKRFLDLPPVLQKGLLRRSLPAVVLLAETQGTGDDALDVRRVLFDRLNTGGIRLNPQELRNALYPGRLNALLIELARSQQFTTTWNIPHYVPGEEADPPEALLANALFASLADAELVLRFFALRDAIENGKQGALRTILDRFMEQNASPDQPTLDEMRRVFTECLARLAELFDGRPFRLPGTNRVSRPLYDALMIALSRNPELDIEARRGAIQGALGAALMDEKNYDILVGRGNTISAVHDRVEVATQILAAGAVTP